MGLYELLEITVYCFQNLILYIVSYPYRTVVVVVVVVVLLLLH